MRTRDRERKTSRCLTLYLASVAMIAAPLCFRTGAEETGTDKGLEPYDFYANTKYPGATLRPDVELYKVKQAGGDDPLAYERREVVWWPRKGVDIIEVKEGMPLRTWTWHRGRQREWSAPQGFEAHLVGFRGMGNTMSSKFGDRDGGPREPAVVLRLPDGRKRCFPTGSFGEEDKTYIMDLYVKEMKRIKAGLDKTKRVKRPSGDIKFPNNAKPGEPGTMQVESEHFVWLSGSQAGSDDDPWVNEKEPDKAQWYRDGSVECAEFWWALNEYAGHLMPYWDRVGEQFKYEITVPGTKRDGYQVIPGYAGGGYGGCGIKGAGGGPWSPGLFHEWGHGARGTRHGGGEALADTHQTFADPAIMKGNHHIQRPWRNIFNEPMGYGFTVFYNVTSEDPNWGYGYYVCLPYGAEEWSILQVMARVGQQRGLFKNGIRGIGDTVGEYGARLATFDCELEDVYSRHYFAPTRNWLETVDADKRIYRIPLEEAPEPFGINITRLVADQDADEIVVDFRGLHDSELYSDWRACVVAVSADRTRRYSPLWNKGEMTFQLEPGDLSHWLTVAATPTALYLGQSQTSGGLRREKLYTGRHSYRYPWSVQLAGARAGTPRECRADLDDASFLYEATDSVPAPRDTPAGERLLAKLTTLQKDLDAAEDKPGPEESQSDAWQNLRLELQAELDRMQQGARHPNGGGWVQSTAKVSPTAYVGPNAMVLDNAQVLDNAIIDDFGVVSGAAVVSGHARVCGQGVVGDKAKADGYARVWQTVKEEEVATVVPKRPGAKDLHMFALWANYAMNRDENVILEDWYRYAFSADRGYAADLTPVLGGYLYGRPEFVVDGQHRGFRFDGEGQYGELCPRAADHGEITVDITLKWKGRGAQTIFDFGCSSDHCLVLGTANNGSLELIGSVAGKTVVKVASKETLPVGQWTNLRVEIDGKKTVLWVDGQKAGETSTTFRPCDVFPGGAVKRNYLAASRDGKSGFKGVVDHVVIYHTVHEDYSALPEPTLDAPVRPTESYIAALREKYGNLKALNAKADALSKELMAPYLEMEKRSKARQQEIMQRCPEYVKAVADLAAAEKAVETRKRELTAAFAEAPGNAAMQADVKAAEEKRNALRNQVNDVEREAFEGDAALAALTERRNEAENRRRTVEQELRKAFDERPANVAKRAKIDALRKQVNEKRAQVRQLEKEAFDADAKLQELYTKRNGHEAVRREREKLLKTEFDSRADIIDLVAKADAARKRRHDEDLSGEERDNAGREEDQLRRRWHDLWNTCRTGDDRYTRAERVRNELNRPISEREAVLRADLRKESEPAREYDDLNHKLNGLDRELRTRFDRERDANPEYAEANRMRADLDASIRARQETLRAELRASKAVYREYGKAEREYSDLARTLRDKREMYTSKGAADLIRKVAEANAAIKEAETLAWKPYAPERWLYSFNQQAFRGYYNTAYNHYFSTYARDVVGGGEMREDTTFLSALTKAVSGDDDGWRTCVDWDWRMKEEVDGSINDMPLMKQWLARVRGPVEKEKPESVKRTGTSDQ